MVRLPHSRPALDDAVAPLVQASVSRRGVLRSAGLGAAAVGGSGLLAACGTSGTTQTAESCTSKDLSDQQKKVVWSNWPLYIDQARETVNGSKKTVMPTLRDFQEQTGITVTYNVDVNDNSEFFAKVRNQLGACEPTGRDIITLTDWMAARMIGLGWVQKLDTKAMPNVQSNLRPGLRDVSWDPNRELQRAVAVRLHRHRLQREVHRRGQELRGAVHPLRPQRQDLDAHRDGRHDGLHAHAGRRGPATTSPTPSSTRRSSA